MPRKKEVQEEVEQVVEEQTVEETEVVTPEVQEEVLPDSFSRCECGKLLSNDKMYNICPNCGDKR